MTRQDVIDASDPHVPGAGIRANYIQKGVDLEHARLLALLEGRTVTGHDAEFGYQLAVALVRNSK